MALGKRWTVFLTTVWHFAIALVPISRVNLLLEDERPFFTITTNYHLAAWLS